MHAHSTTTTFLPFIIIIIIICELEEVLRGKDVLCRGRTGSGKTAAYSLPLLHVLLQAKRQAAAAPGVRAVVLLPTRELAQQSTRCLKVCMLANNNSNNKIKK